MNQEIAHKLDVIMGCVESGDFVNSARSSSYWGGSDVIVSTYMSNDIRKWLDDSPFVISLQNTEPRRDPPPIIAPPVK